MAGQIRLDLGFRPPRTGRASLGSDRARDTASEKHMVLLVYSMLYNMLLSLVTWARIAPVTPGAPKSRTARPTRTEPAPSCPPQRLMLQAPRGAPRSDSGIPPVGLGRPLCPNRFMGISAGIAGVLAVVSRPSGPACPPSLPPNPHPHPHPSSAPNFRALFRHRRSVGSPRRTFGRAST